VISCSSGHEVRGTNNLAVTKVVRSTPRLKDGSTRISSVLNRYALPQIWKINALDPGTMPQFRPYMAQRIDLDGLGGFIVNLAKAAMPLFPDEELQEYIPGAAGPPEPAHYGPADPPTDSRDSRSFETDT
jgi:hypothetical protein